MKFKTNCFVSVVFVFLACSLCSDAQAQSGSRGSGYTAPRMSASRTTSPAPSGLSTSGTVTLSQAAPIAVGSGCTSGNCARKVVLATPVISYWVPMSYPSSPIRYSYAPIYQSPITSLPVNSWQGGAYQTYSAPTCSGNAYSGNPVYSQRR